MKKQKDGMRYPSIDKLLEVIDSKYKLAYAAAKRARLIEENDDASSDCITKKPVSQALEEILNNRIHIDFEK